MKAHNKFTIKIKNVKTKNQHKCKILINTIKKHLYYKYII